jgi:kynurenine formamidase
MNEVTTPQIAARTATFREVSKSPFGADDQIGMLNLMTPESRARALAEADVAHPFDLAVEYFVGMPSFTAAGDPPFQISLTHTPTGTVLDDPMGVGEEQNRLVGYSSDAISLYTHCGTHIDALNHFGYCGRLWNGFEERQYLGSRGWQICGVEQFPPIFARGVLIDVAGAHGLDCLPESYAIGSDDLRMAVDRQGVELRPGDVVLVRTGRMTVWPDWDRYVMNEPGLNREGAEFLARAGAMIIGADNLSLEQIPSDDPDNWQVVHTYLFAEAGVPIMEVVDLEELARDEVHEFAFIGAPMPLRGATGAPLRPVALPFRR